MSEKRKKLSGTEKKVIGFSGLLGGAAGANNPKIQKELMSKVTSNMTDRELGKLMAKGIGRQFLSSAKFGLGATALAGAGVAANRAIKKKKKKEASVDLLDPATLIAMRNEFESIFTREASQVADKVKKASLLKQRLSEVFEKSA